jgi:ATP-binding cassette, subfamily B, vacuolar membrane transporter HMT1/ACLQ
MQAKPDVDAIQTSLGVLNVTKLACPAILLVVFIAAFVYHGIKTAPEDGTVTIQAMRGPGGRPLPVRRKSANQVKEAAAVKDLPPGLKAVFKISQVVVILTFLGNAAILLFETLLNREDEWWPGKNAVVRRELSSFPVWVHTNFLSRYT